MSRDREYHWYTPIQAGCLLLVLLVAGPTVLLPAYLLRAFASNVPVWDPDRRWDGVRGYAAVGGLIYAYLVTLELLVVGGHLDLALAHIALRSLQAAFDFSWPALAQHWAAGLLLSPAFALSLERTQPHTDRVPFRVLSQAEKQILQDRATERKRQEEERQRLEAAEQQRQRAVAEAERKRQQAATAQRTNRVKETRATTQASGPANASTANLPTEEHARNQFLADQANARGITSPANVPPPPPKPKRVKRDKGDGSMDDLL